MENVCLLEEEIWSAYLHAMNCMSLLIVNAIGDIIYANALGRRMIIFNSFTAARDIMSRSIHADRPYLVPQELWVLGWFYVVNYPECTSMGWTKTLVLLPYGERWRKHRRLTLRFLDSETLRSFREFFWTELVTFHNSIWESPDELPEHINRYRN